MLKLKATRKRDAGGILALFMVLTHSRIGFLLGAINAVGNIVFSLSAHRNSFVVNLFFN